MSDSPSGPGWWQASDGKWYRPELHPDYRPPVEPAPEVGGSPPPPPAATPGLAGFDPPQVDQRIGPSPAAGYPYPDVVSKRRSTGRILAIVFGVVFLVLAGGCGAFIWVFRDAIADATVDFSNAVTVDDTAGCRVTGVGFGQNYDIDAELVAGSATVESHYRIDFELVDADERVLGSGQTVFRSMAPGEDRREDVFNTIGATEPFESVSCRVVEVLRVDA